MSDFQTKAEDVAQKLGARIGKFSGNRKPAGSSFAQDMVPRDYPKGAKIISMPVEGHEQAVLSLPTHIRTWWIVPTILAPLLIVAAFIFGGVSGYVDGEWYRDSWGRDRYREGYFSYVPMVTFLIITIGGSIGAHLMLNPRTQITITPSQVTIGNYRFDRKHVGGLRLGYEVSYEGGQSSFMRNQLLFSGLRLSYGRWGEDLPYMVNKYHAAEYVIWVNSIMDQVGAPEPSATDANEGRREQIF